MCQHKYSHKGAKLMPIVDGKLLCICGHPAHMVDGVHQKCGATISNAGSNGEDMTCECMNSDTSGSLVVTDLEAQEPAGDNQTADDPNS
jgi:hypothetical protein